MTSRRSFLALVAGMLAVKPESLVRPTSANPIIPEWWRQWCITDAVAIAPGVAVNDTLFSAPIPSDFEIHSICWMTTDHTTVDDLRMILDSLECRLLCDGKPLMAGPIALFGGAMLDMFHGSRLPMWPALAPQGDFRLEVAGGELSLSAALEIHFQLSGRIYA